MWLPVTPWSYNTNPRVCDRCGVTDNTRSRIADVCQVDDRALCRTCRDAVRKKEEGYPMLRPLNARVVVEAAPQRTEVRVGSSVLHLPEKNEAPTEGYVMAVGPGDWTSNGERRIPVDVSEGDRVLFKKYAADKFDHDGRTYYLVAGHDLIAVIEQ